MEAKLALTEVALESGDKLAAKDATEHPDGKEEGIARFDPASTVEGESAGGHHTMDMGVMFELLIPSVEHAKEADLGTEMFWDRERFREGFRHWSAARDGRGSSCSAELTLPSESVSHN